MNIENIIIGKVQVVIYAIVVIYVIIWASSYLAENNTSEKITNIIPPVLDATRKICNLDKIVVSAIDTRTIDESMLEWSTGQTNQILQKWNMTQTVETCEVVLMNELLGEDEFKNIWRTKLGIKNSLKGQVCTALQRFDDLGRIKYLEK